MKHLLTILVAFITAISVSAQITPAKKTFYFQNDAQLDIKNNDEAVVEVAIVSGKNLVFYYEWQSAKNPQIADADRTDKLYFELTPTQAKAFEANGEALAKANTIRCRMCFCLEGGCRRNIKGVLTVKKASCGKYAVTFKDDPEAEKFLVNETFSLKKAK